MKKIILCLLLLLGSINAKADILNVYASLDCYLIKENSFAHNYYSYSSHYYLTISNLNGYYQWPILKFDFSSLPDSASISSAILYIYIPYKASVVCPDRIRALRIVQPNWTESASWYKYDGVNSWPIGGDAWDSYTTSGAAESQDLDQDCEYDTAVINITSQVTYAQTHTSEIAHVMLWPWGGPESQVNIYDRLDSGTKPYIRITYTSGYSHAVNGVISPAKVLGVEGGSILKVLGVE